MVARRTTAEPREGALAGPADRARRAMIAGAVIVRAAADMVPRVGWRSEPLAL